MGVGSIVVRGGHNVYVMKWRLIGAYPLYPAAIFIARRKISACCNYGYLGALKSRSTDLSTVFLPKLFFMSLKFNTLCSIYFSSIIFRNVSSMRS